ncbi:acyltransferase [Sodaliphilus sp.]|uniref:acyltransferase n=1 Tax=Sodaliphilus sp. TaxID=2815818 RepID=UPI00388D698C
MSKQYNYCLDFIKGLACIFVVFMHCEFPGVLGAMVQAISRFCVPLFFMISGYFCFKPEGNPLNITKKVKHILAITINACIFYTIFMMVMALAGKDVGWAISKWGVFNWVIFNKPAWAGVAGQYWFLFALLYTYISFGLLVRLGWLKQAYWLAGAMFVVYIVLAQGMHLAGHRIPNMLYRNWLVEGFAYFMLGYWIHNYKDKLKFNTKNLIAIIIVSTLSCWVERYIMGRDFGVNIVTMPQVFCLFLYAVNNPTLHRGTIQEIGKRYSMFVYIIHPAVWHGLEFIYAKVELSGNMLAQYAMPIIVVILTLIASHIVYMTNERLTKSKF